MKTRTSGHSSFLSPASTSFSNLRSIQMRCMNCGAEAGAQPPSKLRQALLRVLGSQMVKLNDSCTSQASHHHLFLQRHVKTTRHPPPRVPCRPKDLILRLPKDTSAIAAVGQVAGHLDASAAGQEEAFGFQMRHSTKRGKFSTPTNHSPFRSRPITAGSCMAHLRVQKVSASMSSKSGKTVALISLILEQYRGVFERITSSARV